VWPSHSQISLLSTASLALGKKKPEIAGKQIWAAGGLTDLGDVMLCQKKIACTSAVEWTDALL